MKKVLCDFCATSIKFSAILMQLYKWLKICNLLIYNCIVFDNVL